MNNAAPPCFCATRFATRTASSIAIGASSRTNVWRAAVEACTASGRDQRLAGTGVAALHRGVGRSRGSTEDAVSVSRRSRRGPSSHNPQNSISVCQSRPLRARREASIASTAPTLPAQMAAIRRSTPGRVIPPPERPRSSSMTSTMDQPSVRARSARPYWRRRLSWLCKNWLAVDWRM